MARRKVPHLTLADTLYVKVEEPLSSDAYYVADTNLEDLVALDDTVGEYRLVRKFRAKRELKVVQEFDVAKGERNVG